jgi:hypothetical protein
MPGIKLALRFGGAVRNVVDTIYRDAARGFRVEARDEDTGLLVDVTGLAITITRPGGQVLTPAPTMLRESRGIYYGSFTPDSDGDWRIRASCTGVATPVEEALPSILPTNVVASYDNVNNRTTYTYTAAADPGVGEYLTIVLPATNTGIVRFQRTGGAVRAARNPLGLATGGAFLTGELPAGVPLQFLWDGSAYIITNWGGGLWTGAGRTLSTDSDGALRATTGLKVGPAALGALADVPSGNRPALTYADTLRLIGPDRADTNEISVRRITISDAGSYVQVGLAEQGKEIRTTNAGSGTWYDVQHMASGTHQVIYADSAAVFHLYCGEATRNDDNNVLVGSNAWHGFNSRVLTASAGSKVVVWRDDGLFTVQVIRGSVADAAPGTWMPTQDAVIAHSWQSWRGPRIGRNGGVAWRARMKALGLGHRYYSVPYAGVGASSVLATPDDLAQPATARNYWNQITDTPGQRLLDMVANIIADRDARSLRMNTTAPAVTDIFYTGNLNDMEWFGPQAARPDNHPAVLTASVVKMCAYVDNALGYRVRHHFTPLPSQDAGGFGQTAPPGITEDMLFTAIRMAQLRIPAAAAAFRDSDQHVSAGVLAYIAPEIQDPRTPGDRHYGAWWQARQAERDCEHWAKIAHNVDTWTGLTVVGKTKVSDTQIDITVSYGAGKAFSGGRLPPIALLPQATGDPDTDNFAAPLPIASTRWYANDSGAKTIKLMITLASAYAGVPRFVSLYGAAAITQQGFAVTTALHPATGAPWYLQSYLDE